MPDPVDGTPPPLTPRSDPAFNHAVDLLDSEIADLEQFAVLAILPSFMKTQSKFREAVKEE